MGCGSPNSYTIPGLSKDNYQYDYTVGTNQIGIPPFILNGTYYYEKAVAEGTLVQEANKTVIPQPFMFVIH